MRSRTGWWIGFVIISSEPDPVMSSDHIGSPFPRHAITRMLDHLVDPLTGGELSVTEAPEPALIGTGGQAYPVRGEIPRFVVEAALPKEQASTSDTFSRKWSKVSRFGHDAATRGFHHAWYLERYGWESEAEFARFLQAQGKILDAGCGVGRDLAWYLQHSTGLVAGVDISTAVEAAAANAGPDDRLLVAQADLAQLPFPPDYFDYVACDQVLHHTFDPAASFRHLVSRLRPGGTLAFYVYKVKGPLREFADDHLRSLTQRMTEDEAERLSVSLTEFGKSLTEQEITIEIPTDIPELGITAGTFDLQRWLYWTVFKCFYKPEWDWETNVMTNYDWYRPVTAHRYQPEEIRRWIAKAGLDLVHEDVGEAGLSYRCGKPAR